MRKVTEVMETFYLLRNFLISVNTTITIRFYIMPDYNHAIFEGYFVFFYFILFFLLFLKKRLVGRWKIKHFMLMIK